MDESKTKIVAATVLVVALVTFGIAVAYAYIANTQAANPYGATGSYGSFNSNAPSYYNPNAGTGPYNAYGPYGNSAPYNSGYGQRGGGMGMGHMGGFGMGMGM
jgi:hypothetical protein